MALRVIPVPEGVAASTSGGQIRDTSAAGRVHLDTATVVASAVPSRWDRCTELAGDSQRYNAHPFSDGGSVKRPIPVLLSAWNLHDRNGSCMNARNGWSADLEVHLAFRV